MEDSLCITIAEFDHTKCVDEAVLCLNTALSLQKCLKTYRSCILPKYCLEGFRMNLERYAMMGDEVGIVEAVN